MKKLFNSVKFKVASIFSLVVGAVVTASVGAQAQAIDLTDPLATSSAMFTDNQGVILIYILTIFGVVITLLMVLVLLGWGLGKVKSVFGRRRRK